MKLQKFGAALVVVALIGILSGCDLFAPKIVDDNAANTSDSSSTQTTTDSKNEQKKEETKTDDYATQLAGTYELESEVLTDEDGTQEITQDMYQQMVNGTGLRFTLELSEDGTGTITAPNFQSKKSDKLSFNWKTTDGKSLVISAGAGDEGLEGTVDEDGKITIKIEDDDESMTMVFAKVSDQPGYYSDSSKN
ncbi:MAG: hypothetical protein ACFNLS_03160 [Lancefieldella sp.]